MLKAILIVVIVVAVLVGGLLTLRSSRQSGMPSEDVLERAGKRARDQAKEDEADR